ncbi:MAG: TIGR04295 family B12-binding domain-containing radical SAM protein [Polyangiaceae bacterium]
MRFALVNPPWRFDGSVYFGCREPHLPIEYGYAKALLEAGGHEGHIVDAQLEALSLSEIRVRLESIRPDVTVVTTAPSYLFWRCAPPELRLPQLVLAEVRDVAGAIVVVGPHASSTPGATLRKLGAFAVIRGECEEAIAQLAETPRAAWSQIGSVATADGDGSGRSKPKAACDVARLPPLRWPGAMVERHAHHHHRFDRLPTRSGAEVEASRGCPYACSFCAKNDFRNAFRRRPLSVVLEEIDALVAQGVEYVYFIDEIFVPQRELLDALCQRDVEFGVQLRIDQWTEAALDRLGQAGCVSVEAGVESITPQGRSLLEKKCRLSTDELTARLVHAKRRVPFVQANLIDAGTDDPSDVARWREHLRAHGVWANEPVPMFPYPGSPDYVRRWGEPDDDAWERAHEHYLARCAMFSDLQAAKPLALAQLELADAR